MEEPQQAEAAKTSNRRVRMVLFHEREDFIGKPRP